MIGICILIFFVGATTGMVLTVLATATSYDEDVDDAYSIGYEKGKEEGAAHDKAKRETSGTDQKPNC